MVTTRARLGVLCLAGVLVGGLTGCPDAKTAETTKKTKKKRSSSSSEPETSPEEWAGTYASETMKLVLKVEDDALKGSVTFKGKTYDVEVSGDDELEGSFKSGDDRFDLTIKRKDDKLVLATGGVDHVLTPEKKDNPLAAATKPENPLAGGKADDPPRRTKDPQPGATQVKPKHVMGGANPAANPDQREPRRPVPRPSPTSKPTDDLAKKIAGGGGGDDPPKGSGAGVVMRPRLSPKQASPTFWAGAVAPWGVHRTSSGLSFRLPKDWITKVQPGNIQIGNRLPALQKVDTYIFHKPIALTAPASRQTVNEFAGLMEKGTPAFKWKRVPNSWRDYSIGNRKIGIGRLKGIHPIGKNPIDCVFYVTQVSGKGHAVVMMGPEKAVTNQGLVIALAFCYSMTYGKARNPVRRPTAGGGGSYDRRLVGSWFKGRRLPGGAGSTHASMLFQANGTVYWGVAISGGRGSTSYRIGGRNYPYKDRWKTSGNKLTWYYASGKVEVYRYSFFEYPPDTGRKTGGLELIYPNGNKELWKRN